jgi:glycerol uptake facilitator-like aquaporin
MTNSSLNGDTYSFQIPSIFATGASTETSAKINGLVIYSPFFTVNSASLPTTTTTSSITTTAVSSSSTTTTETTTQNQNYFWIYVAGGISAAIIIGFLILYLRPSSNNQYPYKSPQ